MEWCRELLSTFHMLRTSSDHNVFLADGRANFMSYTAWTSTAQMDLLWVSAQNQGLTMPQKPQGFILITLVLWARADVLTVGQGGKSWTPTAISWWMGRKTFSTIISAQLYMAPMSSRGKDLDRKINSVQFIFFKMSICFVISYIHRKISAFFFPTVCYLRHIFSFLNLASHFKSFSTGKNILSP